MSVTLHFSYRRRLPPRAPADVECPLHVAVVAVERRRSVPHRRRPREELARVENLLVEDLACVMPSYLTFLLLALLVFDFFRRFCSFRVFCLSSSDLSSLFAFSI